MITEKVSTVTPARLTRAGWRLRAALALAACAAVAAQLSGCARGVATTAIKPDGSWTRTVTFHGSKPVKDSMDFGTPIGDAFTLPTGAGWKITHADTKDEIVVVAERSLAPGEILRGDITTKGSKKPTSDAATIAPPPKPAVVCANEVTVRQTAPGVYEYRETFHWTGPKPKGGLVDAQMIADFKKALPPALATDANARDLATQCVGDLWHVFFGPGDPLVSEVSAVLTEPELVERRIQRRIGAQLEQHIQTKFGAQVTEEPCRMIARDIIHNVIFQVSTQTKNAGPGGGEKKDSDNDTNPSASLFITARLPGRITDTNGERDEVSGEVSWGLYPEAAQIGDVTLTATCDTNK